MSRQTETARKDARTAGKTAKNNTRWRTTTRKGERVLIDPDGHTYHGTAKEVRDAALMPDRRNGLAQSLQLARYCRDKGTFDARTYKGYCLYKRREAIQSGAMDATTPHTLSVDAETMIMLEAGSRLVRGDGESFGDYLAVVFQGVVDSLLDVAERVTGKREIPLTRHERAALDAIAAA